MLTVGHAAGCVTPGGAPTADSVSIEWPLMFCAELPNKSCAAAKTSYFVTGIDVTDCEQELGFALGTRDGEASGTAILKEPKLPPIGILDNVRFSMLSVPLSS